MIKPVYYRSIPLRTTINFARHKLVLHVIVLAGLALSSVSCTSPDQSFVRTLPDRVFRFSDGSEFRGSLKITARDGNLYSHLRLVCVRNPDHFHSYFLTLKNSITETQESLNIRLLGARGAHLKQTIEVPGRVLQVSSNLVAASSVMAVSNSDYLRAANWQVAWLRLMDASGQAKYLENPKLK